MFVWRRVWYSCCVLPVLWKTDNPFCFSVSGEAPMWIAWTALDTPLFTTQPLMDTGRLAITVWNSGIRLFMLWNLMQSGLADHCTTGKMNLLTDCLLRLWVFINVVFIVGFFWPISLFVYSEVVEVLLRNEALTNIADNKGCYPLHLAAWKGDEHIVKLLIHQGPSHPKLNEQVCPCT